MTNCKHLKYSESESKRFNLRVFRGLLKEINPSDILSFIIQNSVDLLIFRIPAEKQDSVSNLEQTGIPYIVADTLVYYSVELTKYEPKELKNKELNFIEFYPNHSTIMNDLVARIFINYKNHYKSNPTLSFDLCDAYQEWANNYTTNILAGKRAWLVKKQDTYIGFVTCIIENNKCEIALTGVIHEAAGKGIFSDILRFTLNFFKHEGIDIMYISTQASNPVQKIWNKEGFSFAKSYLTIHVNSLMNVSKFEKIVVNLKKNYLKTWNHFSKMNNRSEIYMEKSKINYLNCGISFLNLLFEHNSIIDFFAGKISDRDINLTGYSCKFLLPISFEKEYNAEISLPYINKKHGVYKFLMKIVDIKKVLYAFAYFDLITEKSYNGNKNVPYSFEIFRR